MAQAPPPRRGGLGPSLEALSKGLISAAIVLALVVIGWAIVAETWREAIVVERIEVPRVLDEQQGLKGEVLASRLVDAIAATSAAAYWRGERKAVAAGWKTADFQVPQLGLSMGALVRTIEGLVDRPDTRVSGELVKIDGVETLRLRITPPRGGVEPVTVAVISGTSEEAAIDEAVGRASRQLMQWLDPVALAAHQLAVRLERLPREAPSEAAQDGLEAVVAAVNACLIAAECTAEDRQRARLIWATAAWRAARRIGPSDPERRDALLDEALDQLERAVGADGRWPVEAMLRRGDVLVDRGRTEEGMGWFAKAAQADPRSPAPLRAWAKALARSGRSEEAIAKLSQAAAIAPADPWISFELGMARRAAGRDAEAIEAFREATRRDARLHCAFEEWGRTLESTGRIEAGQRRLSQAERLRGAQPHCSWPDP
ncbi:MAG: tetratricopeptide repeat protein [Geminicoccaceae bacterium]|nr:tetratricopeptide repeat protein [Geminicoccaceae bacterium]